MFEILLMLTVYSIIVLLFVPLDKIAKIQSNVRAKWQKIVDKTKN